MEVWALILEYWPINAGLVIKFTYKQKQHQETETILLNYNFMTMYFQKFNIVIFFIIPNSDSMVQEHFSKPRFWGPRDKPTDIFKDTLRST